MNLEFYKPFVNSTKTILAQMANIKVLMNEDFYPEANQIVSNGVSSVITYIGKVKGRLVLDMEPQTAIIIARNITGRHFNTTKDMTVLAAISELNNIIAGDGITYLNNKYFLELKLVPPIVFTGKSSVICLPQIPSISTDGITEYGKLKINVAFERSL